MILTHHWCRNPLRRQYYFISGSKVSLTSIIESSDTMTCISFKYTTGIQLSSCAFVLLLRRLTKDKVYRHILEGDKGGYRSRFTENKTALSQFTKNIILAFHASRKIKENILENHGSRQLWKSRFTRKKEPFHISREIKRADHGSRKYPLPPSFYSSHRQYVDSFLKVVLLQRRFPRGFFVEG